MYERHGRLAKQRRRKAPYRTGHAMEIKNEKGQDFSIHGRRRGRHCPRKSLVF